MNGRIGFSPAAWTVWAAVVFVLAAGSQCGRSREPDAGAAADTSAIREIRSEEQFRRVFDQSGAGLIGFELYADWCMPCKILSPILEQVAAEYRHKVTFYKVDIDRNPGIARIFNAYSIPLVVFVRNRKAVHSVMGLERRETYIEAIHRL